MKKVALQNIINIISKNAGIQSKDLNINSGSKDFSKWDSISHVRIMISIEEKFKKKISTSKMVELDTVKKIINYLN